MRKKKKKKKRKRRDGPNPAEAQHGRPGLAAETAHDRPMPVARRGCAHGAVTAPRPAMVAGRWAADPGLGVSREAGGAPARLGISAGQGFGAGNLPRRAAHGEAAEAAAASDVSALTSFGGGRHWSRPAPAARMRVGEDEGLVDLKEDPEMHDVYRGGKRTMAVAFSAKGGRIQCRGVDKGFQGAERWRWLASGAVGLRGKREMEGGRRRPDFGLSREREREQGGPVGA
jgi:hypothetical protein